MDSILRTYLGWEVNVTLTEEIHGRREFIAKLESADHSGVIITPKESKVFEFYPYHKISLISINRG